jgi:hypothetical protein
MEIPDQISAGLAVAVIVWVLCMGSSCSSRNRPDSAPRQDALIAAIQQCVLEGDVQLRLLNERQPNQAVLNITSFGDTFSEGTEVHFAGDLTVLGARVDFKDGKATLRRSDNKKLYVSKVELQVRLPVDCNAEIR